MGQNINIIALDADFNSVGLLNYTNLQWTRNYHECGKFSLQVPLNQYNKDIRYIYTKDRAEMGEVSQVNYYIKNGVSTVNMSGYFIEKKLDSMIVYQKGDKTNITNSPTWASVKGKAETVAYTYFNAFKKLAYTQDGEAKVSELDITAKTDQQRGHIANHQRNNQALGEKLYTILKPSAMSYKVTYNYVDDAMYFEVYKGVDRRCGNEELNNPIIFSTKYGNITNVDLLMSDTKYKQSFITFASVSENDKDTTYAYAQTNRTASDKEDKFLFNTANSIKSNYASEADFIDAIIAETDNAVKDYSKVISLDIDVIRGSYEYMQDFDLGDICSVEIPELGVSVDATITSCIEVFKAGEFKLTLELSI